MNKNSTASSTPKENFFPLVVTLPRKSEAEIEASRLRHEEQKLFKACAKTRNFKPYFDRYPHGQFTKEQTDFMIAQHPPIWLACICALIVIIYELVCSPVFWILLILCLVFF